MPSTLAAIGIRFHRLTDCYPRGISLVLLQFEAVRLVPHAMSENKQRTVRRIGSLHPYRSRKSILPTAQPGMASAFFQS